MLKIKVVSDGDADCKVELTSEDGKDVVSVLHARYVCERDDYCFDTRTIEFSNNLGQRILDTMADALNVYRARRSRAEYHGAN